MVNNGKVIVRTGSGELSNLYLALSVRASESPDRIIWALENGFGIEYTPDPLHPELLPEHVTPFIQQGMPVRYHTRFFDYELGNADPLKAEEALKIHKDVIDAMEGLGEPVVTVHLNLASKNPFNEGTAVRNLTELVRYAASKGITVNLENLKKGPTSDPHNIVSWAEMSGSMITLDMGHAVSSAYVNEGNASVTDIIAMFAPKLNEVHMYAKEEDRHYPIDDITPFEKRIDLLLETGCRWWTIELDDINEALNERELLLNYLRK